MLVILAFPKGEIDEYEAMLSLLPTYNLLLSSPVFVNNLQQKQRFYHVRSFTLPCEGRRPYCFTICPSYLLPFLEETTWAQKSYRNRVSCGQGNIRGLK